MDQNIDYEQLELKILYILQSKEKKRLEMKVKNMKELISKINATMALMDKDLEGKLNASGADRDQLP